MSTEFWTQVDLTPNWWQSLLAMFISMICGICIGWERERREKPAGIKTHAMVAIGSTGFTLVALGLLNSMHQLDQPVQGDPMRLIGGLIGGVGFLGAGAIIQSGGKVRGLTTAASLWVSAAVGVACGLNYYLLIAALFGFTLLLLTAVRKIEDHLIRPGDTKDD